MVTQCTQCAQGNDAMEANARDHPHPGHGGGISGGITRTETRETEVRRVEGAAGGGSGGGEQFSSMGSLAKAQG